MQPPESISNRFNADEVPNSDKGTKELTFSDYLNILRKHKWGIISTGVVGAILGLLVAMKAQPLYQASLTLLAEPSQPRVVTGQPYYSGMSMYFFYKTQAEIIKSRKIAKKVVNILELGKINHRDSQIGLLTPEEKQGRINSQISMVQGGLFVKINEQSKIFNIRFVSHDPQLAADITNAVAKAYIEFTLESRLSQAKHSSSWFTERIEELRKNVLAAENVLQEFQTKESMVGTERSKELEGNLLSSMNQELRVAQTRYSELAKRYGVKHPKLILAKADLEEAKRRFSKEEKKIVGDERKVTRLVKLERDLTVTRQLYDLFVKRFKEVDITSQDSNTNIRILDEAEVPSYPFKPDRKKIVLMYLFGGLFFGIILSIIRERLDNTFKIPEDIEEKLGLSVLGTVPLIEKSKKELNAEFVPERYYQINTLSMFSESINHIRTSILFSQIDKTTKTILVTSSVPGEGKTTTSSNIALSFGRLGRTLLVDADMRKPRVGKLLNKKAHHGLTDFVAGNKKLNECIYADPQAANLFILNAGTIPPNPLELLSSDKFIDTIDELKKHFTYVIIDTSPALPVSDALVLGRIVDKVIMVVQAHKTTSAIVKEALKRFNGAKIPILGVVLAQVSLHKMSKYYYNTYYKAYYKNYAVDTDNSA